MSCIQMCNKHSTRYTLPFVFFNNKTGPCKFIKTTSTISQNSCEPSFQKFGLTINTEKTEQLTGGDNTTDLFVEKERIVNGKLINLTGCDL